MNALAANLVAVKNANGSYGLLQRTHLDFSLELVVGVRTELNTLHLKEKQEMQKGIVNKHGFNAYTHPGYLRKIWPRECDAEPWSGDLPV